MLDSGKICAVVDTNVIVSSLLSSDGNSSPAIVVKAILGGIITPLYNGEILREYQEVLSRPKFPFTDSQIAMILSVIRRYGINVQRTADIEWPFPDPDDIIFYEVKMSVDDAWLITGNLKHFPRTPLVVTPTEMIEVLADKGRLKRQ